MTASSWKHQWLYDPRFWEQFSQHSGPMGCREKELMRALSKRKKVSQARLRKRWGAYLHGHVMTNCGRTHPGSAAIN